ncbi:MAG: hypothetical protein J6K72_10050 [Clostridia bacterium]|nr:hypothetical protein [Clostridia bacterium]
MLISFLFVSKRKETKEKPQYSGQLQGRGLPMMSGPMYQANKSNKKEKPSYFSFESKEKYQKKTAIDWTVVGAWTPHGVQPHASSQQK